MGERNQSNLVEGIIKRLITCTTRMFDVGASSTSNLLNSQIYEQRMEDVHLVYKTDAKLAQKHQRSSTIPIYPRSY